MSDVLERFPPMFSRDLLTLVGNYVDFNFMVGEHTLGDSGYMLMKFCQHRLHMFQSIKKIIIIHT